jgi:hypothetical protein
MGPFDPGEDRRSYQSSPIPASEGTSRVAIGSEMRPCRGGLTESRDPETMELTIRKAPDSTKESKDSRSGVEHYREWFPFGSIAETSPGIWFVALVFGEPVSASPQRAPGGQSTSQSDPCSRQERAIWRASSAALRACRRQAKDRNIRCATVVAAANPSIIRRQLVNEMVPADPVVPMDRQGN